MARRGYLDLSPSELLGRRFAFWGGALFVMPPLLTLCHLQHDICQSNGMASISALLVLWPLYPWIVAVSLLMLCGTFLTVFGGILLFMDRWRLRISGAGQSTLISIQKFSSSSGPP